MSITSPNNQKNSDEANEKNIVDNVDESMFELNISVDTNNNHMQSTEQYLNQSNEELFNIIESQSNEIKSLYNQREEFLKNLFPKLNSLNSKSENIIESLTQQLSELSQENSEIKKKLLQIENSDQKSDGNVNDIYDSLLKQVPLEVLQKINSEKCSEIKNPKEIFDVFDELCKQYSISKKSFHRENVLLGHLKNALHFINNIINSNSLQNTNIDRTLVMAQIARINLFIGQNYGVEELQPVINIFQQNKPEDQIKTIHAFLDTIDVDQNDQSKNSQSNEKALLPFNELYTLFYGILELNNLLFSQLDLVNANILNTAEGINLKKQVHDLEAENHKLSTFCDNINSKIERISNLLSGTFIEQSADIFDMVEKLINEYKYLINHQSTNANNESTTLVSGSQLLSAEVNQNTNFVSDLNSTENNSDINLSKKQFNDSRKKMSILVSQNNQKDDKINYLKEMIKKLKKTISDNKMKLSDIEELSNNQIDELKAELIKTKNDLSNQKEKCSVYFKKIIKQNKFLTKNIKKLANQNKKLQMQKQEWEQENLPQQQLDNLKHKDIKEVFSNIQTQTSNENSDEIISKLQQQISNLESDCSELNLKVESLTENKNKLLSQNSKFKVSERMLKLKISQMEDFIRYKEDQSRTQFEIRNIAMNSQKDSKIQDLTDQIKNYEFLLRNFVETYFTNIQITKEMKYPEIISMLEQAMMNTNLFFSQETLKDADKIRKQCNLKKSDSIYDTFVQIKTKFDEQSESLRKLNEEKSIYTNGIKEAKINSEKMDILNSKLNEWNKWAVSIYAQVSGVISSSLSVTDIRYALEEIFTSTIGQRTLLSKVEILRMEKIMLYKFYDEIFHHSNDINSTQILSIKPLTFILLFTRKLQCLSSCMSISYVPFVINHPKINQEISISQEDSLN